MSHLRKIGDTYYIYWREAGRLRGKKASTDLQTARRIQNELDRRLDHTMWGMPAPQKDMPWASYCEKYIDDCKMNKETWQVADNAIKYLNKKLVFDTTKDLNKANIEKLKAIMLQAGRKPGGINRYLGIYTNMATMLTEWNLRENNPLSGLRKAKGEHGREVRILTSDEIRKYFDVAWGNYYTFGMVALHTGARPGEALMLQLRDFDMARNLVHINDKPAMRWHVKTYRRRTVPMLPQLREYIIGNFSNKIKPDSLLIHNNGQPMTESGFRSLFARFMRPKMGIPALVPYTFRHTYAAHVLLQSKDLWGLSRLLGHRSVRTTELYYAHLVAGYFDGHVSTMSFGLPVKNTLKSKAPKGS